MLLLSNLCIVKFEYIQPHGSHRRSGVTTTADNKITDVAKKYPHLLLSGVIPGQHKSSRYPVIHLVLGCLISVLWNSSETTQTAPYDPT